MTISNDSISLESFKLTHPGDADPPARVTPLVRPMPLVRDQDVSGDGVDHRYRQSRASRYF
jgi:hypothetical protein